MPSMSRSTTRSLRVAFAATILVWLLPTAPSGEQAWQPSHLSDGQPDVQGDWDPEITGTFDLTDPRAGGGRLEEIQREQKGIARVSKPSRVVDPPNGKIPYLPPAAARQQVLADHADTPTGPEHIDPQARCLAGGVPREMFHSQLRVLQSAGQVVILNAQNHVFRVIPLDGRPHVGPHTKLWMGDSRGHWEGTTLVVDVTNQNAKGRLDMVGNFFSDNAHVVERFEFTDANTFNYRATIEDSGVYTRPWTIASKFVRGKRGQGEEYWEDACHEGERSADAMVIRTDAGTNPAK
jgi:hypothetical protein